MVSRPCRGRTWAFAAALAAISPACSRTSLVDLPLWRVEIEPDGQEARVVQLPFRLTAYDMSSHAVLRDVLDRNHDGISDRIVTYQGGTGTRLEETDTNFDGLVDRWDTFGADGLRNRSATARLGNRPDRLATYDRAGQLSRVESDTDLDGLFELVQIYEGARLVRVELDSDGNGRPDRFQDFRNGFLSSEDFDTDEDGSPNLRMTYKEDGSLVSTAILQEATGELEPAP